jgi:hypothetical protein
VCCFTLQTGLPTLGPFVIVILSEVAASHREAATQSKDPYCARSATPRQGILPTGLRHTAGSEGESPGAPWKPNAAPGSFDSAQDDTSFS